MSFPPNLPQRILRLAEELHIVPEDISEHVTRGSGPGGQKINRTENCIELTHEPTRTTVRVQRHRERIRNRVAAYEQLLLKLEEQLKGEESQRAQQRFKIRKQKARRSRKSKEKILQEKHHRSGIKELRKAPKAE